MASFIHIQDDGSFEIFSFDKQTTDVVLALLRGIRKPVVEEKKLTPKDRDLGKTDGIGAY